MGMKGNDKGTKALSLGITYREGYPSREFNSSPDDGYLVAEKDYMFKYYVKMTPDMGRGVFAEKNLEVGEIITNCEILVLSARDTKLVNQTDLQYYTFKFEGDQDCLVLGDGEIFNHDDNSNVSYRLVNINGRFLMEFSAIKPVKKDEQLFINYTDDTKVDVKGYKVNLI